MWHVNVLRSEAGRRAVSLTTGEAAPRSVTLMAYTSHLNRLLKGLKRTTNGVALDMRIYVYPDGSGYLDPMRAKGEKPLALSDQAQLCGNLANLVGLMLREAKKTPR
jgi:hypothetical protein